MNRPPASRTALAAVLGTAALALSACGFTPLYATPGLVPVLSAVEVDAPQGRTGYLLREALDDRFGRTPGSPAAYRLGLKLTETRTRSGLTAQDFAERYIVTLQAAYELQPVGGGEAHTGTVSVEVTYDAADQPYAAIAAYEDAQQRAADEAARRIHLDLAAWLARRGR